MLLLIGGIGSGKSAYASEWARTLGREAIRFSCPTFPNGGSANPLPPEPEPSSFAWTELAADGTMAAAIHRINRESNIFRADRRVLLVDSLSGWLRASIGRARGAGLEPEALSGNGGALLGELLDALLAYQGKRIVVTEEAAAGLAEDPWERLFAMELARAVRVLARESHAVYRLTAGLASEVKGRQVKWGIRER
nr:bifunctional adenosylcobinamide kinase/adenosylcobinamide-phosphate guanylyltransferase [Cohnella sp. CFH 77786]